MQEIKEICVHRGTSAVLRPETRSAVARGNGRSSFGNIVIYQIILRGVKGRLSAVSGNMTSVSVKVGREHDAGVSKGVSGNMTTASVKAMRPAADFPPGMSKVPPA
jgi:hypothetical protein